jgi:hypothetical protein
VRLPKKPSAVSRLSQTSQPVTTRSIFLTTVETADFLRVNSVSLARWRMEGRGPPYKKFGRKVLYSRSDLIAWTEAQTRLSTSDSGS